MKRFVLHSTDKCLIAKQQSVTLHNNVFFSLCNVKTSKGQKAFALTALCGVPVLKIGDQLLNGFSVKTFTPMFNS
jgi:hypothetical protein